MADYLLVIDMQSDYVATGKAYDSEALTAAVNDKIASYSRDHVIYIVNRFFWELTRKPKNFAIGLSLCLIESLKSVKHPALRTET